MEKIQSAIAKARAAREEKIAAAAAGAEPAVPASEVRPDPKPEPAPDPKPQPLVLSNPVRPDAAWNDIPTFKPKAARITRNHIVAFIFGDVALEPGPNLWPEISRTPAIKPIELAFCR